MVAATAAGADLTQKFWCRLALTGLRHLIVIIPTFGKFEQNQIQRAASTQPYPPTLCPASSFCLLLSTMMRSVALVALLGLAALAGVAAHPGTCTPRTVEQQQQRTTHD